MPLFEAAPILGAALISQLMRVNEGHDEHFASCGAQYLSLAE